MEHGSERPAAVLRRLVNGYQVTQAIHVAATLGIADLLADGPRTSDELARATDSHPDALYRLLRALAALGVFHEGEGRSFSLTPVGECLRSDAAVSGAGWAAFVGTPYYWQAWGRCCTASRPERTRFGTSTGPIRGRCGRAIQRRRRGSIGR